MNSFIAYVIFISYIIIFTEYFYSLYKKDNIFSSKEMLGNLSSFIVARLISIVVTGVYVVYLYSWQSSLGYMSKEISLLSFIFCLLAVDFFYYLFHKAHHEFGFLWMFHHVHHSDNRFNSSLIFRLSWVEPFYSFIFIPVLIFFFPLDLILYCYIILYNWHNFTHDPYLKWPHFLNMFLVTPNNHKVHHDQELKYQNSNFGGIFSIWDRLFGTYVDKIDTFTPGIKGYSQDNFIKMQIDPVLEYLRDKKII